MLSVSFPLFLPFALSVSTRLLPPCFKAYTLALHPLSSYTCTYRHVAICLRFCTTLLLSLRRFLAFSLSTPRFSLAVRSYVCPRLFVSRIPSTQVVFFSLFLAGWPVSLSLPFSPGFCISLSFLSPDRAFHSKIERHRACRAHFSSWKQRIPTRWHARARHKRALVSCSNLTFCEKFCGLIDIQPINTCI